MAVLSVPYVSQFSQNACGAAALEMVYRYLRPSKLSKFSQQKVFRGLAELEPHGSGSYRITTDDVVKVAMARGLSAHWGRARPEPSQALLQIAFFIDFAQVPLIACQQYTDEEPTMGHFRVIIGYQAEDVIFHDPCPRTGGEAMRLNGEDFVARWRHTGMNVTGGVAIWIAKHPVKNDPLLPPTENRWL